MGEITLRHGTHHRIDLTERTHDAAGYHHGRPAGHSEGQDGNEQLPFEHLICRGLGLLQRCPQQQGPLIAVEDEAQGVFTPSPGVDEGQAGFPVVFARIVLGPSLLLLPSTRPATTITNEPQLGIEEQVKSLLALRVRQADICNWLGISRDELQLIKGCDGGE